MEALTVNQLIKSLRKQQKAGNGNKKILITSDDEGNSLHELFYGICGNEGMKEWKECLDRSMLPFGVSSLDDYLVLG